MTEYFRRSKFYRPPVDWLPIVAAAATVVLAGFVRPAVLRMCISESSPLPVAAKIVVRQQVFSPYRYQRLANVLLALGFDPRRPIKRGSCASRKTCVARMTWRRRGSIRRAQELVVELPMTK